MDSSKLVQELRDFTVPQVRTIASAIFAICFLFNLALLGTGRIVSRGGNGKVDASTSLQMFSRVFIRGAFGTDSLGPTLYAAHIAAADPKSSIYGAAFWGQRDKFQYPLAWLLPFVLAVRGGASDWNIYGAGRFVGLLSLLLSVGFGVLLADRKLSTANGHRGVGRGDRLFVLCSIGIGGLLFYPLLRAQWLGQAQILLDCGFSLSYYLWFTRRERLSGAAMGAMALVKPQFAVFLLWALIRRKFGAALAFFAIACAGMLASVIYFGWAANLEYLRVLRFLSQHGEIYFPNQSFNGILNRATFNGDSFVFSRGKYPPYSPLVYWGTVLTSVVLLGYALFPPRNSRSSGGPGDFGCLMLSATMASPIAWEHHYGILFPIFVWLCMRLLEGRFRRWQQFSLLVAYALTANSIGAANLTASVPALNLFQSYMYFGCLLALVVLVASMREDDRQAPAATPSS